MAQPALKEATAPATAAEKQRLIDPSCVKINSEGQCWRDVLVRLPEGFGDDDVRTAKAWRLVQGRVQTALIKLDHLLILSFDESTAIRAVVTHAGRDEVHLAVEKKFGFKEQGRSFYTDGTLEVFWTGNGYSVRRIADGVRVVVASFTTEPEAVHALHESYPKRNG